jgi:hypothetical protein
MWCIGTLTREYRSRMYALLELYARPRSKAEPVICIDEKSMQLLNHSREALPMGSHSPVKQDYEYVRNGTTNLFVAVEPKAGQRIVSVTERRGKVDFVAFINELLTGAYAKARRIHLVLDNLNTHFKKCFDGVLGKRAAAKLLRRVQLCGFLPARPDRHRLVSDSCTSAHDLRSTLPSHTRSPSCSCASLRSL